MLAKGSYLLIHELGLPTVAEGIEDQATLDGLIEIGVEYGQGYFLGYPLPGDRVRLS